MLNYVNLISSLLVWPVPLSSYCNVYLQSTHAFRSYNTDKSRVEHCSKRSPQCEKSKYCRYQSEIFSNVLSFIEFQFTKTILCCVKSNSHRRMISDFYWIFNNKSNSKFNNFCTTDLKLQNHLNGPIHSHQGLWYHEHNPDFPIILIFDLYWISNDKNTQN